MRNFGDYIKIGGMSLAILVGGEYAISRPSVVYAQNKEEKEEEMPAFLKKLDNLGDKLLDKAADKVVDMGENVAKKVVPDGKLEERDRETAKKLFRESVDPRFWKDHDKGILDPYTKDVEKAMKGLYSDEEKEEDIEVIRIDRDRDLEDKVYEDRVHRDEDIYKPKPYSDWRSREEDLGKRVMSSITRWKDDSKEILPEVVASFRGYFMGHSERSAVDEDIDEAFSFLRGSFSYNLIIKGYEKLGSRNPFSATNRTLIWGSPVLLLFLLNRMRKRGKIKRKISMLLPGVEKNLIKK